MKKSEKYINRELSWLDFNQRVLDEATDDSVPLLERVTFLAITGSNLDEFFMVRVGGLQMVLEQGSNKLDPTGLSAANQLAAISERTHQLARDQYNCLLNDLEPAMAEQGIRRLSSDDLTERQQAAVRKIFLQEIYTVLTPMAVSGDSDFPLLGNQTLNVCVRLAPAESDPETPRFAVIPFSRGANRILTLQSDGGYAYLPVEDAVSLYVDRFFPGEVVEECVPFRITRNADLTLQEDKAADLLAGMEAVLVARKLSHCSRLEVAESASDVLLTFLKDALHVEDAFVFLIPGPLDLSALMSLGGLQGFDSLRYGPSPPQPSPDVDMSIRMFDVISAHDVLLYQPFDSFEPVVRLIEEAADDPDVLAIKQILYRTSRNSPIVAALRRAAENGKHVTALVELKARFDEARNIQWARSMEQSAVQVIYGVKGLKTHAKLCIIVRREPHGIQRYLHFGTGNYNESTARLYTDASYMTCNEELGADATSFFNAICGYSQTQKFRKLEAAPITMRDRLIEMIETETQFRREGQKARITAKMNSLVDPQIIDALYEASQAGVQIKLNVRGICCLRPGVQGLSENITVTSIIDRFLEHSRIFYFHHGGDGRVFISSADWMPRNLDRRVELLVPIEDDACRRRLIEVLETCMKDTAKARRLLPDGSYERVKPKRTVDPFRSQRRMWELACEAVQDAEQSRRTEFEPHRATTPE